MKINQDTREILLNYWTQDTLESVTISEINTSINQTAHPIITGMT